MYGFERNTIRNKISFKKPKHEEPKLDLSERELELILLSV